MKKILTLLFPIFLIITSCTSRKHLVYMKNIEGITTAKEYTTKITEYKLNKGDIVYLKILSTNKDLNELFSPSDLGVNSAMSSLGIYAYLKGSTVDDSGNITLPIIKKINIVGLTIPEAEKKIQKKVDEFLNNTSLVIKLVSFNISVIGEVNLPGLKEIYQPNINVLEAISRAGDIRETGDRKNILILRKQGSKTISYTIDLTNDDIITSDKFQVMPNDIIIVQPLKLSSFRLNIPAISLLLSSISTLILVINLVSK